VEVLACEKDTDPIDAMSAAREDAARADEDEPRKLGDRWLTFQQVQKYEKGRIVSALVDSSNFQDSECAASFFFEGAPVRTLPSLLEKRIVKIRRRFPWNAEGLHLTILCAHPRSEGAKADC